MSASGCDEYLESSGGLALWASLAFIVVLSFSSFLFCYHRRQKDDEDKLVRFVARCRKSRCARIALYALVDGCVLRLCFAA